VIKIGLKITYIEILYLVIKITKPNLVVETGIGSGSSSLFILAALGRGKHTR
jgi:predicted O-methyltransferase YrrM